MLPPNKAFPDMARGVVLPKELVTEPERHTSDSWSTMEGVVTVPLCLDSLLSAASWLLEEGDGEGAASQLGKVIEVPPGSGSMVPPITWMPSSATAV